jgi:hypothetical protein
MAIENSAFFVWQVPVVVIGILGELFRLACLLRSKLTFPSQPPPNPAAIVGDAGQWPSSRSRSAE